MTLDEKIAQARQIIDDAIAEHNPVAIFAGFSGGHDSLTVVHLAMEHMGDRCKPLHINTGIGIERTRQFVRDTCGVYGWDLWERHAKADEYERFIMSHGFPGPAQHNRMYQRLKERVVYAVCKEVKEGKKRLDRVMFITGIRADESRKRAGYNRVVSKVAAQVWVNPIYYFTGSDKYEYIKRYGLPRNPVVDTLGMSGECLCGAFSHKGEKDLVRIVSPEAADRLDELEQRVNENGFPWGWEDPGPPLRFLLEQRGQQTLFQPLCVGCQKVYDEKKAA